MFFSTTRPRKSSLAPSATQRNRHRPRLERLEDRLAPAWLSIPPATVTLPAAPVRVILDSTSDAEGSASVARREVDWYVVKITTAGEYQFAVSTPNGDLDSVLGVYNRNGRRIGSNDDSIPGYETDSFTTVTLRAGRYYFGITKYRGTPSGSYSWSIDGPTSTGADDSFEDNDTQSLAANLGLLNQTTTLNDLVMADDADWFRFEMGGTGDRSSEVVLEFNHSLGDLDMRLVDTNGVERGFSDSVDNLEQISLDGLPAGTYFVHVYGYLGATNPDYALQITPAQGASGNDDTFEDNDSLAQAANLGTLTSPRTVSGLRMNDGADWFRFTMTGAGTTSNFVRITFTHAQGDLDLRLYNTSGTQIGISEGVTDSEQISLSGLLAGTYYVEAYGFQGATNPSYTLEISPGVGGGSDDTFEENDSLGQAFNLGALSSPQSFTNLIMNDGADWFRFDMAGAGTNANFIRTNFNHAQGDLDLRLYDAGGTLLRTSDSVTNEELISLQELAAGIYYVEVYGFQGALNPGYGLDINPGVGGGGGGGGGDNILYLNFDGATITRGELERWAGNDWNPDSLDPERDGINVRQFLEGRADREQIIAQLITMVQEDLQPFGITVLRHSGPAVEDQGATTVFLGEATISHPHIACTVDFGNDDRTDIAFVGDENWGSANDTAIAMADVTLHEAGHTYGLYHVDSGTALESMGLRYSTAQDFWLQNTSFMNATFPEYFNHGNGQGPQNSFQIMQQNLGVVSGRAGDRQELAWAFEKARDGGVSWSELEYVARLLGQLH